MEVDREELLRYHKLTTTPFTKENRKDGRFLEYFLKKYKLEAEGKCAINLSRRKLMEIVAHYPVPDWAKEEKSSEPIELESGVKIIQIVEIYDNGHENVFEPKPYIQRVRGATRKKLIAEFIQESKIDFTDVIYDSLRASLPDYDFTKEDAIINLARWANEDIEEFIMKELRKKWEARSK